MVKEGVGVYCDRGGQRGRGREGSSTWGP
ncbi:uncharacterized protein G2W53_025115 [Senna tora]|uniref:Uncharacterized protein n=1 Tax=Senna tora TaxID=362788 RepID=A0A834TD85_9FABA|nr:uncharacterized protein G2W53_025115 [Senna tora]